MTATTAQGTINPAEGRSTLASFPRLMAMEWTKLRTVRSTTWSLAIMLVVSIGMTALLTSLTVSGWDKADASQRADTIADPTGTIMAPRSSSDSSRSSSSASWSSPPSTRPG